MAEVSSASCCFKALLQKAHIYKKPIDRMVVPGGGGPEQPRGHCNSVLNIEDKRGLDGVIVFLFSLLLLLLLLFKIKEPRL